MTSISTAISNKQFIYADIYIWLRFEQLWPNQYI